MEQLKSQATVCYAYTVGSASIKSISVSNETSLNLREVLLNAKKFVNQNYFKPGEVLSYTILITNNGNFRASNITIDDDLAHQQFLNNSLSLFSLKDSKEINYKHTVNSQSLVIELESIEAGDVIGINYQAKTKVEGEPYKIQNCAIIYSDEVVPFETPSVTSETKFASLLVSKKTATDYTYYNTDLSYLITIYNEGNLEAVDVELSDQLPVTFELNSEKAIFLNDEEITHFSFDNNSKILKMNLGTIHPKTNYELRVNGRIVK